ncbi:MAG: hypothetical protein C5B51_08360 [Terriglobia bacterium]|nr:MAG: hypothetical protein C5B51_08360 [Terriglobia bacterium]
MFGEVVSALLAPSVRPIFLHSQGYLVALISTHRFSPATIWQTLASISQPFQAGDCAFELFYFGVQYRNQFVKIYHCDPGSPKEKSYSIPLPTQCESPSFWAR